MAEQHQRTKWSGPRELGKSTCTWTGCLEKNTHIILESRIESRLRFQVLLKYVLFFGVFSLRFNKHFGELVPVFVCCLFGKA